MYNRGRIGLSRKQHPQRLKSKRLVLIKSQFLPDNKGAEESFRPKIHRYLNSGRLHISMDQFGRKAWE